MRLQRGPFGQMLLSGKQYDTLQRKQKGVVLLYFFASGRIVKAV